MSFNESLHLQLVFLSNCSSPPKKKHHGDRVGALGDETPGDFGMKRGAEEYCVGLQRPGYRGNFCSESFAYDKIFRPDVIGHRVGVVAYKSHCNVAYGEQSRRRRKTKSSQSV